ncbi:hypothetical protein RI543_000982, partial [Arxiozyma heterogenica]
MFRSLVISPRMHVFFQKTFGRVLLSEFYEYPEGDIVDYNSADFANGGYLHCTFGCPYVGEITGVEDLNWDSGWPATVPPYGYTGVPASNFLMVATGYFVAPMSGVYYMALEVADYAAFFLGAGSAFDCCNQTGSFTSGDPMFVLTVGNGGVLGGANHKVYLERGHAYPFKAIYVNAQGRGAIRMAIHLPGGMVVTSLAGAVFSQVDDDADEGELCSPVSISHPFTTILNTAYTLSVQSYRGDLPTQSAVTTITTTDWLNKDDAQVSIITVVNQPAQTTYATDWGFPWGTYTHIYGNPLSNGITSVGIGINVFRPWPETFYTTTTGDVTAPTTTTSYSTVYDYDSEYTVTWQTNMAIVKVIEPPPSTTYTTTTSEVVFLTTTTYTTTTTDSNGSSSPEVVVVVITPSPATAYTTSTGPVSAPTTTTYTTTVVGEFGGSSPEVVVVVITPSPSTSYTTTTADVTVPTTTTYTTVIDHDGSSSPEVVVEVITPSPSTTYTTTTANVTVPSTTTYTTTITDSNGSSTPEVVVEVITPSPSTSYTTTTADISAPTTTTYTTTITDSNGSSSPEVVVVVITPSPSTTYTTTTADISAPTTTTYTTTVTDSNGSSSPEVVVVVITPSPSTTYTTTTADITALTTTTYTTTLVDGDGSSSPEVVV